MLSNSTDNFLAILFGLRRTAGVNSVHNFTKVMILTAHHSTTVVNPRLGLVALAQDRVVGHRRGTNALPNEIQGNSQDVAVQFIRPYTSRRIPMFLNRQDTDPDATENVAVPHPGLVVKDITVSMIHMNCNVSIPRHV